MKKIFCLFSFFCLSFMYNISAQQGEVSLIGMTSGYAQNGFGISLNYNYYLETGKYIAGEILFTSTSDEVSALNITVPYNSFYFNGGYFYQFLDTNRELFTFSAGGGLSFGYQILNNGDKELSSGALIKSNSKFVIGAFVGLDTKLYISRKYSATLNLRQYYHPNSEIGNFFPYIGIGAFYTLF